MFIRALQPKPFGRAYFFDLPPGAAHLVIT
jgi:hypothetical protein